jgi:hypothetical protein
MALALAARGPSGIPSSIRAQRRDSLNDPLVGFSSSSRCYPKSPPTVSRPKAPLLGFRSLQRMKEKRVHVQRCLATLRQPPGRYPGSVPAGPNLPVTVPLTGFLNLSATSSSLHRPTIFRWVALVGFTLQGVVPLAKPRWLVTTDIPS